MHPTPALALLAALALAAAAAPAQAGTATTQSTITDVKIRLVDLDLNDGIAPGISFATGGYVATWNSGPGAVENRIETPFALGAPLSVTRSQGSHGVAFTVVAGTLLGAGTGPGATAVHTGAGAGGVAGEGQVIFSDFTLTPNTRLEISAAGSATVAGYVGSGGTFYAWAGAGVNIFSSTLQVGYAWDFVNASLDDQGQGTPSEARSLFAAYDNRSSTPFSGSVSAVAYAGASEAAPVPEPATGGLLLAGLLALGTVLRRQAAAPA